METLRRVDSSQVIVNDDHCFGAACEAREVRAQARRLDIARTACSEAGDASQKAVEKSNSDRRPKTPPEEVVALRRKSSAKARAEKKERSGKARAFVLKGG